MKKLSLLFIILFMITSCAPKVIISDTTFEPPRLGEVCSSLGFEGYNEQSDTYVSTANIAECIDRINSTIGRLDRLYHKNLAYNDFYNLEEELNNDLQLLQQKNKITNSPKPKLRCAYVSNLGWTCYRDKLYHMKKKSRLGLINFAIIFGESIGRGARN